MRHDFRKPRPSSVDNLTNEITYVTESEDVFYTYRQIYSTYANAHSLATIHMYSIVLMLIVNY